MFGLLGGAVVVAYHVVSAFALLLAPLPGGLAGAAAIVLFTIAVRLVLLPLSYYAIRGQASQARLGAQVQALRARHAGHPERLQSEMAALYRREGGGMLAGCLPLLVQLPFLSVLYTLLRSGTVGGRPNLLMGLHLFAAPLGSHWLSGAGPFSAQGAVFLGLFVLLAGALWAASRVAARVAARVGARVTQTSAAGQAAGAAGSAQSGAGAGLLVGALPYVTLVIAAVMPLAAGLYLLTTTAWAAGERAVLAPRIFRTAADRPPS
ncbi:MAG TPA: membrane protein insertase YidC [Streptosporangiaceae bacterium]|nr:membrane protein insertase YidC [Streptosporangiaceae bacterium]